MNGPLSPEGAPFYTVGLLLAAALVAPGSVRAQEPDLEPAEASGLAFACSELRPEPDDRMAAVFDALALDDRDETKRLLRVAEEEARLQAEAEPDDLGIQYGYAVALGARSHVEGGRTKVTVSRRLHEQLGRVLEMAPDHAGALHLMGRLHAGVMRTDRITRFIATRLLGGGTLSQASWEEAQRLLEGAEREDPCVPDHHYELGRLYAERGRPERARDEMLHVLELESTNARERQVLDKARSLLERLER